MEYPVSGGSGGTIVAVGVGVGVLVGIAVNVGNGVNVCVGVGVGARKEGSELQERARIAARSRITVFFIGSSLMLDPGTHQAEFTLNEKGRKMAKYFHPLLFYKISDLTQIHYLKL